MCDCTLWLHAYKWYAQGKHRLKYMVNTGMHASMPAWSHCNYLLFLLSVECQECMHNYLITVYCYWHPWNVKNAWKGVTVMHAQLPNQYQLLLISMECQECMHGCNIAPPLRELSIIVFTAMKFWYRANVCTVFSFQFYHTYGAVSSWHCS